MSDLEKTEQLFTSLGIGYERSDEDYIFLKLEQGNAKVVGYNYFYFYVEFLFDLDGAFKEVGIWE